MDPDLLRSATTRAATRVNTEQASKRLMRGSRPGDCSEGGYGPIEESGGVKSDGVGPIGVFTCSKGSCDTYLGLARIMREGVVLGETQEPPCGTNVVYTNV